MGNKEINYDTMGQSDKASILYVIYGYLFWLTGAIKCFYYKENKKHGCTRDRA